MNAGWVSGDYAVWQKCPGSTCSIWRYRSSTDTRLKMPSEVPVVYSPAVTATVRSSTCAAGYNVRPAHEDREGTADGTKKSIAYSFPRGVDGVDLFAYPNLSTSVDLYLSRVPCRTFDFDVYVMNGV